MRFSPLSRAALLGTAMLLLAACDSAEERAEGHFNSSLELIESGDVERALVELRNVLSLDEFHVEGRRLYAETVRARGNFSDAYANYLRIAEQDPNDLDARMALSEMAIEAQNWDEVARHAEPLIKASERMQGVDVIELVLEFRAAALADEDAKMEGLTSQAIALIDANPEDVTLLRIIIEGLSRQNRIEATLEYIDRAIALEPDSQFFYGMKSSVLAQLEDFDALENHLRATVAAFPEDASTKGSLVRLLTALGRPETAEEFLREQIAETEDSIDLQIALISFIREVRGSDAALQEIEGSIARYQQNSVLRALRSGVMFDAGDREAAITEMQSLVDDANPEDDQTNDFKVTLARMLISNGNDVGARQLVEEVLAQDPSKSAALKLSAGWLIESDQIADAINALRRALDQEPQDFEAMTLMAQAHQRAGETELAQDMLSLAAEASNYAPEETIRFVRTLIAAERLRPAEDALVRALRQAPADIPLLQALGEVYLRMQDWPRALQVEATLRRTGSERATGMADSLRLQILSRRDGRDQAIAALEAIARSSDAGVAAQVALLRARLGSGEREEALAIANEIVSSQPDNPRIGMVLGGAQLALRDYEDAEATFARITETVPEFENAWVQLIRSQSAQGRLDAARETLDNALAANPDAPNLLWAQATFLERANDIDGAIEIYSAMYEQNSSVLVVANNLASLLATYKTDDESLDRAFSIARRLRGTAVPPFQDTYGWILHRRGQSEEAIEYLEPAAAALANDPIVQYHLASAYEAVGRTEDALLAYQRALELVDENDPRPQIEIAQTAVERLTTGVVTE
ncbi:MAG: tetratricopeptide repeat protein [Boseongicola sp.]|nr:tetratricopeptide repeat protein [Boseongicola sp.]NNJ69522.1 tetratricopeptide repeat protein [Boseongicola sp.]